MVDVSFNPPNNDPLLTCEYEAGWSPELTWLNSLVIQPIP